MKNIISNFAQKYQYHLETVDKTWFNGHGNFPLDEYRLKSKKWDSSIHIKILHKQNEFSKARLLNDSFTSRVEIEALIQFINHKYQSDFKIEALSYFKQLFGKNGLKVSTSDDRIEDELTQKEAVQVFFLHFSNDLEFDPLIEYHKDVQELSIRFQVSQMTEEDLVQFHFLIQSFHS